MLVLRSLQQLHVHIVSPLDLEARQAVQQHETDQLEVLHVLHILEDESLQVPQPPDTLQAVPVDGPAARDVEVLQGVVELSGDSVHTPLINVLAVREIKPLQEKKF